MLAGITLIVLSVKRKNPQELELPELLDYIVLHSVRRSKQQENPYNFGGILGTLCAGKKANFVDNMIMVV